MEDRVHSLAGPAQTASAWLSCHLSRLSLSTHLFVVLFVLFSSCLETCCACSHVRAFTFVSSLLGTSFPGCLWAFLPPSSNVTSSESPLSLGPHPASLGCDSVLIAPHHCAASFLLVSLHSFIHTLVHCSTLAPVSLAT